MSLDAEELLDEGATGKKNKSRIISQRQYKRKIKRECPSYVTLERKRSDRRRGSKEEKKEEKEKVRRMLLDVVTVSGQDVYEFTMSSLIKMSLMATDIMIS